MTSYKLEMRLPSCFVTASLIKQVEDYIRQHSHEVLGFSEEQLKQGYSVTISESIGKECLESVNDVRGDKFADTTEAVALEVKNFAPTRIVRVTLNSRSFLSKIEIDIERPDAREVAIGLYDGIAGLIAHNKTFGWIFYPSAAIDGALVVLYPAAVVGFVVSLWRVESIFTSVGLAMLLIVGLIYHVGRVFTDYTEFDSRRVDIRRKIRTWAFSGIATFVVFGTILSFFRNILFNM